MASRKYGPVDPPKPGNARVLRSETRPPQPPAAKQASAIKKPRKRVYKSPAVVVESPGLSPESEDAQSK